jgi:hypothetical protein
LRPRLPLSTDFGNANSSARGSRAPKPVTLARRAPKMWNGQAFADIEAYGGAVPANVARSREARWGKGALPKGHPYDVKIDKA